MYTFSEVITNVERLLRQEAGQSVQQYAEGTIAKLLQDSFDRIFKMYWLPEYYNPGEDMTLDGTTGKVTNDLTAKILKVKDIRFVWMAPYIHPLTWKPPHLAPTMLVGLVPMLEPVAGDKIFRVFPVTTAGTITVAYRTPPATFTNNADVPESCRMLMEAEAAFVYATDDGANDLMVKRLEKLVNDRDGELRAEQHLGPRPLAPGRGAPLTVWTSTQ